MKILSFFIFLSYLVFFIVLPPFQNPDEPSHYETVYWTSQGFYPYIPNNLTTPLSYGRNVEKYFDATTKDSYAIPPFSKIAKFSQNSGKISIGKPTSIQAYNPPVYYIVAAILLRLSQLIKMNPLQQFYMTRLASGLFYFGTLVFAYKILQKVHRDEALRKGIFVSFALNPLFLQSAIGISPDIAVVFFTTVFFCLLLYLPVKLQTTIPVGLTAGVALLCKISAIFLLPLFVTFLFYKKMAGKEIIQNSIVFLSIVFITQVPWFLFNMIRYHTPVVSDIALGTTSQKVSLMRIPYGFIATVWGMRHTFMHFSGFLGWNNVFPFSIIFIPFTVFFILFIIIGFFHTFSKHDDVSILSLWSVIYLLVFFLIFETDRVVFHNAGWEIGGRNILPIFMPLVLFVSEGLRMFLRKKDILIGKVLIYFSIFYYFFILIFVLIPRYYV